jgi:2,5-diketo-D-gluconate reductase A
LEKENHLQLLLRAKRKCVLKSRQQVLKDRCIRIPVPVFLEAAKYGLGVAKKGLQQVRCGTMYWHDPWGIREALLYSLQNACIAQSICNACYARSLEAEMKRLTRSSSASVRSTVRFLEEMMNEDWTKASKSKSVSISNCEQLNNVQASLEADSIETSSVELSDGSRLPQLGFGTAIFHKDCMCEHGYRCHACSDMKGALHMAVVSAVKQGYRHFDCAQCYNNEDIVGEALRASGVERKKLFLASKLSYWEDYGSAATPRLVRKQLQRLRTSHLDLYYLHDDICDFRKEKAAWRALERLHDEGVIKYLGLSNYRVEGIKRIMKFARVWPSVLQVKYDVYHPGYQ